MSTTITRRVRSRRRVAQAPLLLGLLAIFLFAPVAVAQDSPVGVWEIVHAVDGEEIPVTLTLQAQDGILVGTWATEDQEAPIGEVIVEGTSVSFTHPVGDDVAHFRGTLEGESLSGTCTDAQGREHHATGQRRAS